MNTARVLIKCVICDREFYVIPYRKDKAKYCSRDCFTKSIKFQVVKGLKFNRLTLIKETEPEVQYARGVETKIRRVYCVCECGNTVNTRLIMVINGDTKSCGCLKVEQNKLNLINNNQHPIIGNKTEGLGRHPLYSVWSNMKARCYNVKCEHYKDYGGRGILMSDRWLVLENFIFDMYPSYKKGLEIERMDNDGNYELGNCMWVTKMIQSNNKRNTVRVLYEGNSVSLGLICKDLKLKKGRVYSLMKYYKISFEEAVKKY